MKPIPTRESILARLAQGPAQFQEFAQSRSYKSKSLVAARTLLNELEQEGAVMRSYIGRYPYYLLNNESSIKAAQDMLIEEGSKSSPCGCTNWTGYIHGGRGPFTRMVGQDRPVSVRRFIWERKNGDLKTVEVIKMTCENPACINPKHMKKVLINSHRKGEVKPIATRMRIAVAMRKLRKLSMEDAQAIRASTEDLKTAAERYGVTRSNISFIRRGKTFRDYSASPFAGLGAR